jgi:hypothetical protein
LSIVDFFRLEVILQSVEENQKIFKGIFVFLAFPWFFSVLALADERTLRANFLLTLLNVMPQQLRRFDNAFGAWS